MRNPALLRVLALVAALGCSTRDTTDDAAPETTPAATSESTAAVGATPWYLRARALDLTGDGQADSVRLEAVGTDPDSLGITLSFIVAGEEKHREQWGSSYELAHLDTTARDRVDAMLRARLDSVLASVVVQRLDAPGVQLMAEDSVILARLEPQPTHRVSVSYGFETTARLVWDAPRARFVRLWSCC